MLPRLLLLVLGYILGCGVAAVWGALLTDSSRAFSQKLSPPPQSIGREVFSLNIVNLEYGVIWPTVPFFSWRNFHSAWEKIESRPGQWNFFQLDQDISLAEKQQVEILLQLVTIPQWAKLDGRIDLACRESSQPNEEPPICQSTLWKNYVRTVATRYKGRVHAYELWNEPNVKEFFTGTVSDLVTLNRIAYQTLKEIDPTILVVSSSLTRLNPRTLEYLKEFFKQGGGQFADVISHHFYPAPDPPETMLNFIQSFHSLMREHGVYKPVWNTETGWNMLNRDRNQITEHWAGPSLNDELSQAYMARTYLLSWASGIERVYWYAWGHRSMGMTEHDGKRPKAIATAFLEIQHWIVGSQMEDCRNTPDHTWICKLFRNGQPQWIIWNAQRHVHFHLPPSWKPSRLRYLDGRVEMFLGQPTIDIGPVPILLERIAP